MIKGFPRGGLIIVSGIPGTGKTIFASSFIYHGAIKYGNFYRELSFIKMRGSEVRNQRTFFTVHGGLKVMIPTKILRKQVAVKLHYPDNPPEELYDGYTRSRSRDWWISR